MKQLQIFLFRYKDRISPVASLVGAVASISGVVIPVLLVPGGAPWWAIVLVTVSCLLTVLGIFLLLKPDPTTHTYGIDEKQKIRNYMLRWIRSGSKVVIWTRDMSWVNDEEMNLLLRSKAEAKELVICLPQPISKSEELLGRGADVYYYGTIADSPGASTGSSLVIKGTDRG